MSCLAAATKSLDLQMILKDEQPRLDAAAVVKIGCCHGHSSWSKGWIVTGNIHSSKDGYDRQVVHNKEGEQIGAGQWSSEISWTPPRLLATNSGSGKSSREHERRRAGVGWALHRRSAGIAADLLGLRPGEYGPGISTTG